MKHAKQIKKPISFFLALITACLFVGQGIVFDSANVEAAEDSFKLFGIDTDMTAKEFAENIGIYAKAILRGQDMIHPKQHWIVSVLSSLCINLLAVLPKVKVHPV